jgi:acetyl esterase/lipase
MRGTLTSGIVIALLTTSPARADHLDLKDIAQLSVLMPTKTEAYGPDPLQVGELRMPKGTGPFPIAIIVHGGCYTKGFATLSYMAPLASALTDDGIATWNIEYRQVGDPGGGWPGTFEDWAAASDHLRELAKSYPLDLKQVIAVGHSAGATGVLWIAARPTMAATNEIRGVAPINVVAAVAIDGPVDLRAWVGPDAKVCGKPVVAPFMGGTPEQVPSHYDQGNPFSLLPFSAKQFLVVAEVMTAAESSNYSKRAMVTGNYVRVLTLKDAAHFDMLAPGSPSWKPVEQLILKSVRLARH